MRSRCPATATVSPARFPAARGKTTGHPGVIARWPVVGGEFLVGLEAEAGLDGFARKDERDLRPDGDDLRQIGAEESGRPLVPAQLRIDIADRADLNRLRKKLGSAPVEMPVPAVPVVGARIRQIVGETGRDTCPVLGSK